MNAMRKTDCLTDAVHSSIDGIHLVRPDVAQVGQAAAPVSKVLPCGTALAAERITAAVLLVMCIAAAVFV
jgi:hypothetical protein